MGLSTHQHDCIPSLMVLSFRSLCPWSCLLVCSRASGLTFWVPYTKLGRNQWTWKPVLSPDSTTRSWSDQKPWHGWLLHGEGSWMRTGLEQCEAPAKLKWEQNICVHHYTRFCRPLNFAKASVGHCLCWGGGQVANIESLRCMTPIWASMPRTLPSFF
jgi:hypothetical protein